MKLRTLGAATLVAALAAGTLLPTGVLAVDGTPDARDSTGTIRYEQTTGGDPGDVTDPEDGDDIDEPETNPNHDPLMIIGATSYDFIDADADGNPLDPVEIVEGLQTYDVVPFEKMVNGESIGKARHFVEFRDIRATEAVRLSRNYDISAAITSPFMMTTAAGEEVVLNGAQIHYNNVQFAPQPGSTYETGVSGPDYTLSNTVTLTQGGPEGNLTEPGASATFLDVHSSGTNAAGRFHLLFGTDRPAEDATHDDSVQLEVPAGQIITEGEYSATITWTIADTPTGGETGETETGEEAGA